MSWHPSKSESVSVTCPKCGRIVMNINELAKEIHQNAVEHGWWDKPRSFGEIIALCHSELSEALEAYRSPDGPIYYKCTRCGAEAEVPVDCCGKMKPEGIAIELADCIIRILDYCGYAGIDIKEAIMVKHTYNKTRPLYPTGTRT